MCHVVIAIGLILNAVTLINMNGVYGQMFFMQPGDVTFLLVKCVNN